MHAADGLSHRKQFSVSTSGVVPQLLYMLPEDIGRQTALLLIEERVRVSQGRRHEYSRQKADISALYARYVLVISMGTSVVI